MDKLSILLATHNGARYLPAQIESILAAVGGRAFEIIACDDASRDETVQVLRRHLPPNSRLLEGRFGSPARNFEYLLPHAAGNIIFLSDQDDVWLPEKVDVILDIFQRSPQTTLVISDATVINEDDEPVAESFYELRRGFHCGVLGTIASNKYHGCAMAFRRELIPLLLPFPKQIPMHDAWIGIVNDVYGKTHFIDRPLMQYRRHSRNASLAPGNHAGLWQMLRWRLNLTRAIAGRCLRHPPVRRIRPRRAA